MIVMLFHCPTTDTQLSMQAKFIFILHHGMSYKKAKNVLGKNKSKNKFEEVKRNNTQLINMEK